MDITEFTKEQTKFLKAEHVDKSPTKIFVPTGEATTEFNDRYKTTRLHVPGQMDETDYIFDCSKTNGRTISLCIGSETKEWIGKQIRIETYKTKTSDGEMVNAINVIDAAA